VCELEANQPSAISSRSSRSGSSTSSSRSLSTRWL